MSVTTIRSPILQLNGPKNYEHWRLQVCLLLKAQDLWKLVCGALPKPTDEAEKSSWETMNAQADWLIIQTIDSPSVELIYGCSTSKETWDCLESYYSYRSEYGTQVLLTEFFCIAYKDEQRYVEFYLEVKQIVNILLDMGENLGERMIVVKIVSGLPDKLAAFKEEWREAPEDTKTMTHLYKKLQAEDLKQSEKFVRNRKGRAGENSDKGMNNRSRANEEAGGDFNKRILVEWSYVHSTIKEVPEAVNESDIVSNSPLAM